MLLFYDFFLLYEMFGTATFPSLDKRGHVNRYKSKYESLVLISVCVLWSIFPSKVYSIAFRNNYEMLIKNILICNYEFEFEDVFQIRHQGASKKICKQEINLFLLLNTNIIFESIWFFSKSFYFLITTLLGKMLMIF